MALFRRANTTIDLGGADLRNANLYGAKLTSVGLDGADLRGASAHYAEFGDLKDARFDGADLSDAYFHDAEGCTFRKAVMSETWLGFGDADGYTRCDFTGAKMAKVSGESCRFVGSVFEGADLSDGALEESDFSAANLAGAIFDPRPLFAGPVRRREPARAILFHADLRNASLVDADLRRADLREAILSGADLSGAQTAGADFAGAVLTGTKIAGVDFSRARTFSRRSCASLARSCASCAGRRRLEQFVTRAEVELGKGEHAILTLTSNLRGNRSYLMARSDYRRDDNEAQDLLPAPTFEQGMLNLVERWPHATLRLDTIQARGSRTVRGEKLRALALAAWARRSVWSRSRPRSWSGRRPPSRPGWRSCARSC